jgi:serine/threonine protein phosphatase PrpC
MDELRSKFDTLLEASLQQMSRDDYGNNSNHLSNSASSIPSSTTSGSNHNLSGSTGSEKAKRMSPTSNSNTNPILSVPMSSSSTPSSSSTGSGSGDDLSSSHSSNSANGNNNNTSPSSLPGSTNPNDKNRGTPTKQSIPPKKNFFMKSFSHLVGDKEPNKRKQKEKGDTKGVYALDEDVNMRTEFVLPLAPSTSYQHLPRLQVCPLVSKRNYVVVSGPTGPVGPVIDDESGSAFYSDVVAGRSISTYPHIPGNPNRDGDPIADRFAAHVYENRVIACMADGCNWGAKPREAATKANAAFIEYVNANHDTLTDVKRAGAVLLNAFEYAHNSIMEGKIAFWDAGTTTLLGGVLLEINKGTDKWTPQWEFVCASVGDCKAFCYANGEITDITPGNRQNANDPRDCGGRLGPHLDEGKPDLRNLNLFCASCEDGDLIIIVTDGIHDNLDPQHLGKVPKDMPKEFNLVGDKWDDVDPAKAIFAKNAYVTELLQSMLKVADGEPPTPQEVADRLVNHCIEVTKKSREYMENNQGRRLPEDYVEFPGKMDHTSCLCFRVGRFPTLPEKGHITTPASTATFGNLSGSSAQVQQAAEETR